MITEVTADNALLVSNLYANLGGMYRVNGKLELAKENMEQAIRIIEALPYKESSSGHVITTFLHGMYYPRRGVFTHIDYTKNQYSGTDYVQKYADSVDGMSIDPYTATRDLHYKIWCIENGEFSRDTWYKLMIVSLGKKYQKLLNEILS